ncbi:DUF5313 family protein [Actinomycetes bacterium KLBMP 9759]
MKRPNPLWWLWYAMGGGLPPRHQEWVLHDVTATWWRVRAFVRSLVQILPVAVLVYFVVPGEPWVRLMAVAGGVFVGMIYGAAFQDESTEHRAVKAGYPRGTATAVREEANADERAAAELRYAARYRHDGPPDTVIPRNSA